MRKLVLFLIPALTLPLAASADHHDESCDARASLVVAQLERESAEPLSASELDVARRAARASCQSEGAAPRRIAKAGVEEDSRSGLERFWQGLFASEPKPAKQRAGKYRYIEKD